MSFWERLKAFFAEEEPSSTIPLDEWAKHELTIKCLEHITQEISRRCRMAENQPLQPAPPGVACVPAGFAIDIYKGRIWIGVYDEDRDMTYSQAYYSKLGYADLTEYQTPRFAEALHQKLYGTYLNNPKIKFKYSYDSSWEPHGHIFVDIDAYHPRLKKVNL